MMQDQRELDELQKRIDQRFAQLERDPSDWRPCAVSIDGGPLRYADINLTLPEPELTSFGNDAERLATMTGLGQWVMEVDGVVDPSGDLVTVRFGADVLRQPLESKVFVTWVESRHITGEMLSRLQSNGPLTYHHESEADRG